MSAITVEGIVENGSIRLLSDIRLPEKTKVYIIAPSVHVADAARITSPRLRYPQQATDFEMEVESVDASV